MERNKRVHGAWSAWMNGVWTSKNIRVRVHVWNGGYVELFGEKSLTFWWFLVDKTNLPLPFIKLFGLVGIRSLIAKQRIQTKIQDNEEHKRIDRIILIAQ